MKPVLMLSASAALLAALAEAAHADCAPVIAAFDKADATKRYAMYEVDTMAQAPKGDPFMVVIGDAEYRAKYERKGPLSIVKTGFEKTSHVPNFERETVKANEKKGDGRCEPLGERKIGSEAAIGYRIRNNKGKEPDLSATDMWISRASGLPLFTAVGGSDDGGFRWVYGGSVMPPAPGAGK